LSQTTKIEVRKRKKTLKEKLAILDEALGEKEQTLETTVKTIELPPELKDFYEERKKGMMNYRAWNPLQHLEDWEREQMGKRFLRYMSGKSFTAANIERTRYQHDPDYMPEKEIIEEV